MNTIQDIIEMIETFYALKRMHRRLKRAEGSNNKNRGAGRRS